MIPMAVFDGTHIRLTLGSQLVEVVKDGQASFIPANKLQIGDVVRMNVPTESGGYSRLDLVCTFIGTPSEISNSFFGGGPLR